MSVLTKLDSDFSLNSDAVQSLSPASLSSQNSQLNKDVITQLMFEFHKDFIEFFFNLVVS
jgi:hypothetical protein